MRVIDKILRDSWIWFDVFFFFLISNKYIYQESPNYTGIIPGWNNQLQKLLKSNKSTIEKEEKFLKAVSQSNKVQKKKNLRSGIKCSVSSKLLLFLSLQMHHIRQFGIIVQMWPFRWRPNWPCQQTRSSTTDFGITQKFPKRAKNHGPQIWNDGAM